MSLIKFNKTHFLTYFSSFFVKSYVTCCNEMSHVSKHDFKKTPYKRCTVIFDDFDFFVTKAHFNVFYQLAMRISNLYYYLVHFVTFLKKLCNISSMNFINHTCSSRILRGFPRCVMDISGTTGKPSMSTV